MLVSELRLESLFKKIDQIREEARAYLIEGDRSVLRVEELQKLVEQMYSIAISKFEVASNAIYLQSMVLRFSDERAIILVRSDLNEAQKRFCVVKELCHLVLDEREDWSTDAHETIEGLIRVFALDVEQNGEHDPGNDVLVCEYLAGFAAAELLYPFERREKDIQSIGAGATTFAKLGLEYEVPPRVISLALDATNLALCRRFRNLGKNNTH